MYINMYGNKEHTESSCYLVSRVFLAFQFNSNMEIDFFFNFAN